MTTRCRNSVPERVVWGSPARGLRPRSVHFASGGRGLSCAPAAPPDASNPAVPTYRRSSLTAASAVGLFLATLWALPPLADSSRLPAGRKPFPCTLPRDSWRVRYRHGGVRSGRGLRPSSAACVAANLSMPLVVPDSVSNLPAKSVCVLLPNQQVPEHPSQALGCRARAPPCPPGLGRVHPQLTVGSARRHNGRQGMGYQAPGRGRDGPRPRVRE
jgi:hypothetical protein